MLGAELTDPDSKFERGALGVGKRDADQVLVATGCKRLEEYLVRLSLNDQAFSALLRNSIGESKAPFLITQMRNMVRDVTLLH